MTRENFIVDGPHNPRGTSVVWQPSPCKTPDSYFPRLVSPSLLGIHVYGLFGIARSTWKRSQFYDDCYRICYDIEFLLTAFSPSAPEMPIHFPLFFIPRFHVTFTFAMFKRSMTLFLSFFELGYFDADDMFSV